MNNNKRKRMKITTELLGQIEHVGFLKSKDTTFGHSWNKLLHISLLEVESHSHLNFLNLKINTSDENLVVDRECLSHLYLLDSMSRILYVPIIDVVEKVLLNDGTINYKLVCKDIYDLEGEAYDFMFYKEYLAQFDNIGILLWNYKKRQIDNPANTKDIALTVYNKEIKNINLKNSKMFKVELRLEGLPQRANILKEE